MVDSARDKPVPVPAKHRTHTGAGELRCSMGLSLATTVCYLWFISYGVDTFNAHECMRRVQHPSRMHVAITVAGYMGLPLSHVDW